MFKFPRLSILFLCIAFINCEQLSGSKSIDKTKKDVTTETGRLDNEFLINGTVFNTENESVYFFKRIDNSYKLIDSTLVINNSFTFKGEAKTPSIYGISKYKKKGRFYFLVDNSSIDLFLNERPESSKSYSSTSIQKDYKLYTTQIQSFKDEGMQLYYGMKGDFSVEKIKDLKQKRFKLFAKQNDFTVKFVSEHPNSYYSAILINDRLKSYDFKVNRPLFNVLSKDIKTTDLGIKINTYLTEKENESKIVITKPKATKTENTSTTHSGEYRPKAYAFNGENQYGEPMSLASIPKGKVILLDFWASWCAPCRATNPTLVGLYNKYNSQGFEIMSVSEDKGQGEWITAINIDNLTWDYHILDKNKSIAFRYGVEAIPFKILIDKNGNIASEKISGRALERKIIQLLAE